MSEDRFETMGGYTSTRRIWIILLLLSSGFSSVWAIMLQRAPHQGIIDFKMIYIAARCLIQHRDPYNATEFQYVFQEEGGQFPSLVDRRKFQNAVMMMNYPPTALLLVAPFALCGWTAAHILWTILTVVLFSLASCLMWNIASDFSPPVSAFLLALVLTNTEVLFAFGNAAGIAVSLCVVAVWTLYTRRFAFLGVLCLAASLAMKPHDSFAIWLYFLVLGGLYRKRAIQTLIALIALSLPATLWISHVSPHWYQEIHSNLEILADRGGINDPGPSGVSFGTGGMIINLQTVVSVFHDDSRVYNPVTFLLCTPLLVLWLVATFRVRDLRDTHLWLALAGLVPLSLLPVYHRPYDAKLLLLAVPACASMWARRGPRRWIALITTTASILLTSDIPGSIIVMLTNALPRYPVGFSDNFRLIFLTRPIPLVLLAMCIFYVWEYLRQSGPDGTVAETRVSTPAEPASFIHLR